MSFCEYKLRPFGLTDTGKVRKANQDRIMVCPELGFFAVADGMGGMSDGEKAAAIIAASMPAMISECLKELQKNVLPEHAARIFKGRVEALSATMYKSGSAEGLELGSTFSGVWFIGGYAVFCNVGDSRGYLLRRYSRKIERVTKDHNLAALLVERHEITPEEAPDHPSSSRLTRCMGLDAAVRAEVFIEKVDPGDTVMLCSDGLHGMVRDGNIIKLIRSSRSPARIAQRLIDEANAAGGRDNISAVIIKIGK